MSKSQLKAVRIAESILASLKVSAGMKEVEVAQYIKDALNNYKSKPAFRIIVASGKRSALPHGFATNKVIKNGDLVVVDFGAVCNGYLSDITRTKIVGQPNKKQEQIFSIVKEASRRAIKKVKAGIACSEVDAAARDYIREQGYGKYFIHTTGHGVGRKIHEVPKISRRNRNRLKVGTVITIEPGIYIKGWGGVRVEEMVVVTKRGCRILTKLQRNL
ncbi:hypothetical protein A2291_01590 [candidate division WOR-1 bacterium RIFOXYB2_FULL_42_35]|uniref:Peptidase M24 domain-containing protein n=1 Tax=candidate division WOR-1 bacterium RIFOXYC2_FULL_41_25 TaxID=1802586 RepID=A0A1F4TQ34_UNCSA|nr:MAG: hypothetical protein A2247_03390 [candidate division WOR-1 bacterium RIFOXYA2_FULL_41_14]OGC25438.1 MAG: hypothetical protein A2291_01590 [candidate division WOR-1 bacterium RIFOXYB2_FULL_42_35]OGC34844.1 MAG: hypothetical protein A2462_05525 [candidate division WOR-1 bacterium RIFOXYC2_FULL_41_25]